MGQLRWWVLSFLAGVVLLGAASGFLWQRRAPPPALVSLPPRERCAEVDRALPPLQLDPVTTPVLLWAVGKVRIFIDGAAAFSPPDAPRRFAQGEHLLRAEAEGAEPLQLRFVLSEPAFFHLALQGPAGLSLAWLGADCVSCSPGEQKLSLDFTRTSAADEELLTQAAHAARAGDWKSAAGRLRGVSLKSRAHAAFLRLAAGVYQATGQPQLAEDALKRVPPAESPDLDTVLTAWQALGALQAAQGKQVQMLRWNRLTEKFSALLEKFAPEAPGPVQLATGRLADLSAGFLRASQQHDEAAQGETVRAAAEALGQFVRALRRSRPDDCEFQSRISASL